MDMWTNPDLARRSALQALLLAGFGGAALPGCGARALAPHFSYTPLSGQPGDTFSFRGQVVLVNFWATSCAICVKEMPALVALHHSLAARGLRTLAVSMRSDPPALVAAFAEQKRLPFEVAIDHTGAIAQAFGGMRATPSFFVIDKQSRIADQWVGAPDFKALPLRLQALLAQA
jgi:peroxiredoxin